VHIVTDYFSGGDLDTFLHVGKEVEFIFLLFILFYFYFFCVFIYLFFFSKGKSNALTFKDIVTWFHQVIYLFTFYFLFLVF
jgi:hypothetical protein